MRTHRIKSWLAALALGLLFSISPVPALAQSPAQHAIVIDDDPGGLVDLHVKWYKRLLESGTPVRLRGLCDSSCTLVLMLPKEQVCVEDTATLGFHYVTINQKPDPALTAAMVRRYYPDSVQEWLDGKIWRLFPLLRMSAAEIVETGTFMRCEKD